jgi:hypothetical protein
MEDAVGEFVVKLVLWLPLALIGAFPLAFFAILIQPHVPIVPELTYGQWYGLLILIRVLLPK